MDGGEVEVEGMGDKTYYCLVNAHVDHLLEDLQPRLDQCAEGKAKRWEDDARRWRESGGKGVRGGYGHEHWQASKILYSTSGTPGGVDTSCMWDARRLVQLLFMKPTA